MYIYVHAGHDHQENSWGERTLHKIHKTQKVTLQKQKKQKSGLGKNNQKTTDTNLMKTVHLK